MENGACTLRSGNLFEDWTKTHLCSHVTGAWSVMEFRHIQHINHIGQCVTLVPGILYKVLENWNYTILQQIMTHLPCKSQYNMPPYTNRLIIRKKLLIHIKCIYIYTHYNFYRAQSFSRMSRKWPFPEVLKSRERRSHILFHHTKALRTHYS
jgi:hypothetical protein